MTEELTLHQKIDKYISASERYHRSELERYAIARKVTNELMPLMPHTLKEHFDISALWTGWMTPPAAALTYVFQAKENLEGQQAQEAFGTIIKVAAGLMHFGCEISPLPKIEAANGKAALNVEVEGYREPDNLRITISFSGLPETDRCKLIEEEVEIPARVEKRMRVECGDEPFQLVTGAPALPEGVAE